MDPRQRAHFSSKRCIEPAVGRRWEIAERDRRIVRQMGRDIGRRDLKQIGEGMAVTSRPAGAARNSAASLSGCLIAYSAAIQPPSEKPPRLNWSSLSASKKSM